MRDKLYCVTAYFNPAGYQSRRRNYRLFADALKRQHVPLVTVELAFDDGGFELPGDETLRLRAGSVLWQKERMLNHAMARLPDDCGYVAWVDADILFANDDWGAQAIAQLRDADVLQLYETVHFLPPNCHEKIRPAVPQRVGGFGATRRGVMWQNMHHPNWLDLRRTNRIPYAEPGFAWAAKRSVVEGAGLYDRLILGSGDALLVDACLGSWGLHPYWKNSSGRLREDMRAWAGRFNLNGLRCAYLAQDIFHLFHGVRKDRSYNSRQHILLRHDFDPLTDLALERDVYEWRSSKPALRQEVRQYFQDRREDALG